MNIAELKQRAESIDWHHSIDLGNGITTPGGPSARKMSRIGLPDNLQGKTVLDVGAWDGFYSFEAHRRGASRVLATDSHVWNLRKKGRSKEGFLLARSVVAPSVEDMDIDVLDLTPERVGGMFDIVLFLGVLYHMRHPLLALERVFNVTSEMAIIETATDMLDVDRPALAFYPDTQYNGDATNWYGPNPQAVHAMLKAAGFRETRQVYQTKVHFAKPHTRGRTAKKTAPDQAMTARAVFHAWR